MEKADTVILVGVASVISASPTEFPIVKDPAGTRPVFTGVASTAAVTLLSPEPSPAKIEFVMKALVMRIPLTTLLARAALPPFAFVASCQVAGSSWLLVIPFNRANGTTPLERLLASSPVRLAPLPVKVPEKLLPALLRIRMLA